MRKSCFNCARKHLAQALVIAHELPYYAGNEEDDHQWVMVGYLAEAADQIQKTNSFVASKIRDMRLQIMADPKSAYLLDINEVIREITELAAMENTQPQS